MSDVSVAATVQLPWKQRQGFTLFELLLAVFLLSLLFGALIFSFSTLKTGAELNEGIDRVESLLRFARAHAAFSGCRVQLQFLPDPSNPLAPKLYRLSLAAESDPSNDPGTYRPLPPTTWNLDAINDVIAVSQVTHPGFEDVTRQPESAVTESDSVLQPDAAEDAETEEESSLPPLTFFPDGTSDSAHILLVSRSQDDPRRVLLRLAGITGSFSHEWIAQPQEELLEDAEEESADLEDTVMESDEDWLSEFPELDDDWVSEPTDSTGLDEYDWMSDVLDELEQINDAETSSAEAEIEEPNRIP